MRKHRSCSKSKLETSSYECFCSNTPKAKVVNLFCFDSTAISGESSRTTIWLYWPHEPMQSRNPDRPETVATPRHDGRLLCSAQCTPLEALQQDLRNTHPQRLHSSSFLGLPYRILKMNPKKEPLWSPWVYNFLTKILKPKLHSTCARQPRLPLLP